MTENKPKKYRKRPVDIEAMIWDGVSLSQMATYLGVDYVTIDSERRLWVNTLEGVLLASPGDFIIKGIKGEFYPCRPDIFLATYEPIEDDYYTWGLDTPPSVSACSTDKKQKIIYKKPKISPVVPEVSSRDTTGH